MMVRLKKWGAPGTPQAPRAVRRGKPATLRERPRRILGETT